MIKLIHDNRENLDNLASRLTADALERANSERGQAVLAVPGGRSVSGIFRKLAGEKIDWAKTHIFMADERLVPPGDKDSNFTLVKENLTNTIIRENKTSSGNIHPFIYHPESKDVGLGSYEKELKAFGGRFDVVILSAGEDGHIAALYPRHHSLDGEVEYFISMDDSPKEPPRRMSSSLCLLKRSGLAILLFYGEGKREALKKFLDKGSELSDCPAKLVNSMENAVVLTDIIK